MRIAHLLAVLALTGLVACSSPLPNRDPTGERFPTVTGTPLDGGTLVLPDELAGEPALLLVGYVQDAQFDLDRWLIGLLQLETPVRLLEVPTIDGLVPGLFAGSIDGGMRKGIPSEDWGAVVTVYDDAEAIVEMTGDTNPRNGRVLLLDREGVVRWFHDRGFSAGKALELDGAVRAMLEAD